MIPTPHIEALKEDISNVVIMPGDPMRSAWMARSFLEKPRLVNNIRGVQGYTGLYKGKRITIMSSGMGIPSISIYAYELYNFYGTDLIIRTGTCGGIRPNVHIGDLIISDMAYTNSGFLDQFDLPQDYIPKASEDAAAKAALLAEEIFGKDREKAGIHTGPVLTQEIYYSAEKDIVEKWQQRGVLGFEMEAAALFANAAQAGKKAAAIFTVSNDILTASEMDPHLRETSLTRMSELALELSLCYAESCS